MAGWRRVVLAAVATVSSVGALTYSGVSGAGGSGTTYSSAVTGDLPLVYYRLDESSGTTAADSSGQGHAGTYGTDGTGVKYAQSGALTDAQDASDTAISVDGSVTEPVTSVDNIAPTGDSPWTMEAWYRSTSGNPQTVVSFGAAGTEQEAGLSVWPATGGTPGYRLAVDLYQASVEWDGLDLNDGLWHQIAVSYAGGGTPATPGFAAYVDGQPLGPATSNSVTFPLKIAAGPVRVGGWTDTSYEKPLNGSVDEAAVYPSALAAARVSAHYAAAGSRPGIAAHVAVSLSNPSITADGKSTTVATATVTDASGMKVSGDTVAFASSDTGEVVGTTSQNSDGTYSATITASKTAASSTITATDSTVNPNISGRATLAQTPAAASKVQVSLNPSSVPADGKSMATATVTVADANGNPVGGDTLVPTSSDTGVSFGAVTKNGDGSYTFPVTASKTPGSSTLAVTDGSAAPGTTTLEQYAPAPATPPACTDTWTGSGDGNWTDATKWTNGVPGANDVACLPAQPAGQPAPVSYKVTAVGSVTTGTVILGSASSAGGTTTQTLAVTGQGCPTAANLTVSSGVIQPSGTLDLTSDTSCGAPAATFTVAGTGTLTNLGTMVSDPGYGGPRYLSGNVVNQGTVNVATDLNFGTPGTTFDNQGTVNTTGTLTINGVASGAAPVTFMDDKSGTVTGGGNLSVGPGDAYLQGDGTVTQTNPPLISGGGGIPAAIEYTGTGASTLATHDQVSLSGNLAAGQELDLKGTYCPDTAAVTAAGDFTNAGTIELTADNTCGGPSAVLVIPPGSVLTNTGKIVADGTDGGTRYLQGNIVNQGTVSLNTLTEFNQPGSVFNNQGSLQAGGEFTIPLNQTGAATSITFKNTSGTITTSNGGYVFVDGGNTWEQGDGSLGTGSTAPIIQGWDGGASSSTVHLTGHGSVTLDLRDKITLEGNVQQGQSLVLQGIYCGVPAVVTATGSFENAGIITMANTTTCNSPDDYVRLPVGATLTNSGTIITDPANGGARHLQGNLVNTGTILANAQSYFDQPGATFDNRGELALTANLDVPYNSAGVGSPLEKSFKNDLNGDIGGTARLTMEAGNSFQQGDGTVSGSVPPLLSGQSGVSVGLTYTGAGSSTIVDHDLMSLSGNLRAGQTLVLEGQYCGDYATATASADFGNAGTIELSSSTTCNSPGGVLVILPGATMTNSGTVLADPANGGTRYLRGNITNTGTVTINDGTRFDQAGAVFDNQGTVSLNAQLLLPYNPNGPEAGTTFKNTSGTIQGTNGNNLFLDGGNQFIQGGGKVGPQSPPVFLQGNSGQATQLTINGTGATSFEIQDLVNLTGDVAKGQVLNLEGRYCGDAATLDATGSFANEGLIDLTSVSNCNSPASTINLPAGATLTNRGTIQVDPGQGGARQVNGGLANSGAVTVNSGTTLTVSGATSNTGTVSVASGAGLSLASAPTNSTPPTLAGNWQLSGSASWPGAGPYTTISGTVLRDGGTIADSANGNTDALAGLAEISPGARLHLTSNFNDTASVNNDGALDLTTTGQASPTALFQPQGYMQTSSATMDVSVGRLGTSVVAPASGTATLAGTLAITTVAGFTPRAGSRYQILSTSQQPMGRFTTITGNDLPDQPDYTVTEDQTGVWLQASAPTTTTLASSSANDTSTYGTPVTFTATVTGPTAPTGTVTFTDSSGAAPAQICQAAVTAAGTGGATSTATCQTTTLGAGTHQIQAVFSDKSLAFGGSSATLTQAVNQVATATTLTATPSTLEYGTPVALAITAAPTAGTGNLDGPAEVTVNDAPGGTTGTTGTTGMTGAQPGCAMLDLKGGQASCTVSDLPAGAQSLTATFAANANALTSSSPAVPVTVQPRATTASIASDQTPAVTGQPVTFTFTAAAGDSAPSGLTPSGRVSFFDATAGATGTTGAGSQTPIAGCAELPLDSTGTAACTTSALQPGTHAIAAAYSDPAGNFTPVSAGLQQVVGQSGLSLSSSASPVTYGNPVTFTAGITGTGTISGSVTFQDSHNGAPAATLCGPVTVTAGAAGSASATCSPANLDAGIHQITATYTGDANNARAAGTFTEEVNPRPTTATVASSAPTATVGSPITFTAQVSSGTGTVTFWDQPLSGTATQLCSGPVALSGTTATCTVTAGKDLPVGLHSITASYSGDLDNSPATATTGQAVGLAATTTSVGLDQASKNPAPAGSPVTFVVTVAGAQAPTGTVTVSDVSSSPATNLCTNAALTSGTASCAASNLATGGHTILATYSGDSSNATSSATFTETVQPAATKTTVALQQGSTDPSTAGTQVTFVAGVTGGDKPTGTVTFTGFTPTANSVLCSTVALASGSATCTTTLATGTYAVLAEYSGDANNLGSSGTLPQTANPPAKATPGLTLGLTQGTNPSVSGATVTFQAAVTGGQSPTGTVTFESIDGTTSTPLCAQPVQLDGNGKAQCATSPLATGAYAVVASYSGDANNSPATATVSQTVDPATPAISLSLTQGTDPSTSGDLLTFQAQVSGGSSPTGTVTFTDGAASTAPTLCSAVALSSGVATCQTSTLPVGGHAIVASYSGDPANAPVTTAISQDVNTAGGAAPTATAVALQSGTDPSAPGQPLDFVATVSGGGAPTGTVTFKDYTPATASSPTILCSAVALASGSAACSTSALTSGAHAIVAYYSGDGGNQASSGTTSEEIAQPAQVVPALAVALTNGSTDPADIGQAVSFMASLTGGKSPTGSVTFQDITAGAETTLCNGPISVASGSATCATSGLPLGSNAVVATYSGDAANAAVSATTVETIQLVPTTTALSRTTGTDPSIQGSALTLEATVTGTTPTGKVTFSDGPSGPVICTVTVGTDGTATCDASQLAVGDHTVTAAYSGDTTNAPSVGTAAQVIDATPKATTSTSVALTTGKNPSTVGDPLAFTATVTGGSAPGGSVTFIDAGAPGAPSLCAPVTLGTGGTATCTPTSPLTAGSHAIVATYSGDANNASSYGTLAQEVLPPAPASSTVSLTSSSTAPSIQVNTPVTYTAAVTGGATAPTGTVSFTYYGPSGSSTTPCSNVAISSGSASCRISFTAAGAYAVVASYSGDANNAASSATISQTVVPAPLAATTATLTVSGPHNPPQSGDSLTFTAALAGGTNPTGTVSFVDYAPATPTVLCPAAPVATGAATCTYSQLATGDHAIVATYSGDSANAGSSATLAVGVGVAPAASTAMDLSMNPATNPVTAGSPMTFSAALTGGANPSGSVTFTATPTSTDSSAASPTTLCSVALDTNGNAACTPSNPLAPGSYTVVAAYPGDPANSAAAASLTVVVTAPAPATTKLTFDPTTAAPVGSPVTFTVNLSGGSNPTGTVTFTDVWPSGQSSQLCASPPVTVSGGRASCTTSGLAAGSHAITAGYSGDANNSGSSATVSQEIDPATKTASKTSLSSSVPSGTNPVANSTVTFTAKVTGAGTPTGTVSFQDTLQNQAPVTLCTATLNAGSATCATSSLTAGAHAVTAQYGGDTADAPSSSTLALTVTPAAAYASACTSVSLQASGAVLTASAAGCPHPQYEFLQYVNSNWQVVQNYSSTATYTATAASSGWKYYAVWAKDLSASSSVYYDTYAVQAVNMQPTACTGQIVASPNPVTLGGAVGLSVPNLTGACSNPQYRFLIWEGSGAGYQPVPGSTFSTSNTFTWTDASTWTGAHYFQVDIRNNGTDNYSPAPATVYVQPATRCTGTPSVTVSPQSGPVNSNGVYAPNTAFTVSASETGCNPVYSYLLYGPSGWQFYNPATNTYSSSPSNQVYTTRTSFSWPTSGLTGGASYTWWVEVHDAADDSGQFVSSRYTVQLTNGVPCADTNASYSATQAANGLFTISVSGISGCSNPEYQYQVYVRSAPDSASGNWVVLPFGTNGYTTASTVTWQPPAYLPVGKPYEYWFVVWARNQGNTNSYDVWHEFHN